MRKIKLVKTYTFVNANGTKLHLNLGIITEGLRDETPIDSADKGFRWMFEGREIPMPVRSGYWFNGMNESIMLDWLKGNGWALHITVSVSTGRAHIYDLPTSKGNNIPKLEHVASAQEMYNDAIPTALENAMKKISEAKDNGQTHCYISSLMGKIPVEVIQSLLDAGYDIKYHAYHKGYGDWFVEVFWAHSREKGKLLTGGVFDDPVEVTIQDYKNA